MSVSLYAENCHRLACAHCAGGWDNKIKYWDLRTNASVGEVQLEAKVYAMDTREQLLVVGTSEQQGQPQATSTLNTTTRPPSDRSRKIYCFNLKSPTQPLKVETSPLQYQTRCVAAFPGNAGYLVGSIEGRVGVQNFDGMHPDKQPSYTFKCHRRTLDASGNIAQNTKQVRSGLLSHRTGGMCAWMWPGP
jgi:mRNA export factor